MDKHKIAHSTFWTSYPHWPAKQNFESCNLPPSLGIQCKQREREVLKTWTGIKLHTQRGTKNIPKRGEKKKKPIPTLLTPICPLNLKLTKISSPVFYLPCNKYILNSAENKSRKHVATQSVPTTQERFFFFFFCPTFSVVTGI